MKQFINDLQAYIPVYLNNAVDFICKIKNDLYLKSITYDYLEQVEYLNLQELRYFLKNNSELLPEKVKYTKNLNIKKIDVTSYDYYLERLENLDSNYFENLDKLEYLKIKKMCELETKKEIEFLEKNKVYLKINKDILLAFLNCLKIILVENNKNIFSCCKKTYYKIIIFLQLIILLLYSTFILFYQLIFSTRKLSYLIINSIRYYVAARKNITSS